MCVEEIAKNQYQPGVRGNSLCILDKILLPINYIRSRPDWKAPFVA